MKLFSEMQIRQADQLIMENEKISSIELMERAAEKCTEWILKNYGEQFQYLIVCGNGNNGGDGLAIARQLFEKKCSVLVYYLKEGKKVSEDFSANLVRLASTNVPTYEISDGAELVITSHENLIIIDAIFGTGLSREPSGASASLIDRINSIDVSKISIDLPSGLFCEDNSKNSCEHIVHATHTLTFHQPKLSFLFAENFLFVGKFHVLPIGLKEEYLSHLDSNYNFITHDFAKKCLRPRNKFAHKGNFGHGLLVVGSKGKMGAAVLSARACLHAGIGLLTVEIPKIGNDILQIAVPEAMVHTNEGEEIICGKIEIGPTKKSEYSAIGIGSGIGTEDETSRAIKLLLNQYSGPFVFDADAINILSENKTWLAYLPKGTILTPHVGEFDRLTEKHVSGFARMKTQKELAVKNGIYIVLKGAHTSVACPDGSIYFNSSGNSGMATGGSGDVLTGILTALRSQAYHPQHACALGVYVHGLAGDIAASVQSEMGMSAMEIVENLGGAWRMLQAEF